jgi:hypothetical protein
MICVDTPTRAMDARRRLVMTTTKEPAWITAKVDQRLALMAEAGIDAFKDTELVMTPLAEPSKGCTDAEYRRWDRTCDNCGAYCPRQFFTGHVVRRWRGVQVIFSFGVCLGCKTRSESELTS